jgi:osmotically-inducible protein OsmY
MGKTRDIREAVDRNLRHDPLIDAADVVVRNIDGDVALTGTVPSYPQYLEAARAARRVAGVTDVHNHLEVVLPPEDHRDDVTLTNAANNALASSDSVPEGVSASAKDGNVTLTGIIRFGSQRTAAEEAVGGLTGVRNVHDEIEVAFDVDYARVKTLVVHALDSYGLPRTAVAVDIRGTTVMLVGQVQTQDERDAVVDAAWQAPDVMAVVDAELQVTG